MSKMYNNRDFGENDFLNGVSSIFHMTIKPHITADNERIVNLRMCQNFFTDFLREKFEVVSKHMAFKWEKALKAAYPKCHEQYCIDSHTNGSLYFLICAHVLKHFTL